MRFALLKKARLALWAAGLLTLLCACSAPAAVQEPTPTPETPPTAAPLADPPLFESAKDALPDFLSGEELDLYRHARSAAYFLMGCETSFIDSFPLEDGTVPDWNNSDHGPVEIDGQTYLLSIGRYRQWADFAAMMDGLFTPAYQEELLTSELGDGTTVQFFTSTEEGRLCYLDCARGSDFDYNWCDTPDSFELVSRTGDEVVFNLVGHYATFSQGESWADGSIPVPNGEYTRTYPIRLERTDAGWRVAELHVAW